MPLKHTETPSSLWTPSAMDRSHTGSPRAGDTPNDFPMNCKHTGNGHRMESLESLDGAGSGTEGILSRQSQRQPNGPPALLRPTGQVETRSSLPNLLQIFLGRGSCSSAPSHIPGLLTENRTWLPSGSPTYFSWGHTETLGSELKGEGL